MRKSLIHITAEEFRRDIHRFIALGEEQAVHIHYDGRKDLMLLPIATYERLLQLDDVEDSV